MRHAVDPRQPVLFDPFADLFSPLARKRLLAGWPALFRAALLELMPVRQLGEHFHPTLGRPTKELFSLAGLLFLQESFAWTNAQAVEAYLFRTDVQFALNLEPGQDELCERTLERYRQHFLDDDLAAQVMDDVTKALVDLLELDVARQRLDSTHVFSNMASFGRTRLMGVAIKRFLTQVQRHEAEAFHALPDELRQRYAPSVGKLFAQSSKSPEQRAKTLQQVAEDLRDLIDRFADQANLNARPSYQALVRMFEEQCEIVEDTIQVRAKSGGRSLQNPSDPDATYDGHKGQGYKVQLSETCGDDNEVQLLVGALVQTAADADADAVAPMLEKLKESDCLPESMLADTAYGSDENVQRAAAAGVELVSPVAGPKVDTTEPTVEGSVVEPAPAKLSIDDFALDERTGKVDACPSGKIPLRVLYDAEKCETTIEMNAADCQGCPFGSACPMRRKPGGKYEMSYTDKQRRLEERRREEQTEPFRERYAKRSGLESTNSGLKRRQGLGRLRIRGMKGVAHALYLKIAGWNMLRAVASAKVMAKVAGLLARLGLGSGLGDLAHRMAALAASKKWHRRPQWPRRREGKLPAEWAIE